MVMRCKKFVFMVAVLVMSLSMALSGCGGSDGDSGDGSTAPEVETRSGIVSGIMDDGARAYLGLPFAAPPVGDLRWRLPEQESPWTGVYEADSLKMACPQDLGGTNIYGLTEFSEDCLYLNVWAPEEAGKEPLPVMFWMHGGGYTGGSATMALYNGAALAQKGVIVVTANYRLGPLGFMVHQGLYDSLGQSGNYGLYDQVAALNWVQGNIAAFGGDPDNVTIFGESSGGCSVTLFQTAPITQGLFRRAISQSGTVSSNKYILNLSGSWQEAASNGAQLQDLLGAADIEEMRQIPARDIIEAVTSTKMNFGPAMDGVFLSDDPRRAATETVHTPMIIGTVGDEGTLFIWEYGIETLSDYGLALLTWFGENAEIVYELFPASTDEEAMYTAATVLGLAGIQEPVRHTARGASLSEPVYRYIFRHVPPTLNGYYLGSYHGSELAYVFGNLDPNEGYLPEDHELSDRIMDLWTSFAKTGVPAAEGLPDWPEYATGREEILNINGPGDFGLTDGLADAECDFFESIAPTVEPDYPQ